MTITKDAQAAVADAIAAAEKSTSIEIVVASRDSSGSYSNVTATAAAVGAVVMLAFIIFADIEFDPPHALPLTLIGGLVGAALALFVIPLSWMTRAQRRATQVNTEAFAEFARGGVYKTRARTGMLVYLSQREKTARLLMDVGVLEHVPEDVRQRWKVTLDEVAHSGDATKLVQWIRAIGDTAQPFLPCSNDDVDELANISGEGAHL